MSTQEPTSARVVIIGGGIIGCSIAYHLSEMGWTDVVVLERSRLTLGSTFHAAGLVGQLRSSLNITRMLGHSVELYSKLEALTGQSSEWKASGGLRVASSKDRLTELKRQATLARSFGLPFEILGPDEAVKLFPIMKKDGIVGAVFLPTDGQVNPSGVTVALAKGAKSRGVRFLEGVNVTGFTIEKGQVREVVTEQGRIQCEVAVNAAGLWAREIGLMAGVSVPVQAMQHQYLVTDVHPDIPKDLPTMRDPDLLVYFKEESGALVMGGYEHDPLPWAQGGIPRDFNGKLLDPDFEHFEPLSELAIQRVPLLENIGIKRLINGPEAFTPDGTFIMGEAPEVRKFFVAAGFNAHGIAAAGGAGKAVAEWIINGEPSLDLWAVDIRRFSQHHRSPKFLLDRTLEAYGKHYAIAWPDEDWKSCRNLRRSPLHETLKRQGACYASKQGWERPNWFAPEGVEPVEIMGWGRPNYFPYVAQEHKAAREAVVLFDQTPFSKFEIKGRGALKALNFICANQIDKPVGSLTYTQMCNQKGGIECDLTVARVGENEFYVVTGTAFAVHDSAWIKKNLPRDADVAVSEATSAKAVINVCGPRSRELLQKVAAGDLSNEAFPFMQCRELSIGWAPVLALRVTYIGELGYELHVPSECALYVYETLWAAGRELGVKNAGYRAIESLRLEKGYRYWSADINGDYNPFEAGLGFAVKLDKGDFIGRAALQTIKAKGLARKLCAFTLEKAETMLFGNETLYCGDTIVGRVTSGGYGHTVKQCIAYAYASGPGLEYARAVEAGKRSAELGDFSVEVLGERIRARFESKPLYDPSRSQMVA